MNKKILNIDIEEKIKNSANLFLKIKTRDNSLSLLRETLKPLDKDILKDYLQIFFNHIIENEEIYEGKLFFSNIRKQEKNYKNMIYFVKEYVFWSLLYPNEVKAYFEIKDNGEIIEKNLENKERPSLISKEYKQISKKDELGFTHYSYEKPALSTKLDNGWIYENTKNLLTFMTVGYFEEVNYISKQKLNNKNIEKKSKSKKVKI